MVLNERLYDDATYYRLDNLNEYQHDDFVDTPVIYLACGKYNMPKNKDGNVEHNKVIEFLNLLQQHGADINLVHDDMNALDMALWSNVPKPIIRHLVENLDAKTHLYSNVSQANVLARA